MALGDTFMYDPDGVIVGETTDYYFQTLGAFEIISFNFGLVPEGGSTSDGDEGGGGGAGAGGGGGTGKPPNMGAKGLRSGGTLLSGQASQPMRRSRGAKINKAGGTTFGGKPKFGTLTIQKNVDKTSTQLYTFCSMAQPIPTLNIAVRKEGGDGLLYVQYCFRYNQVTGVAWQGGEGDRRVQETLTIEFVAMGMQYIEQLPTGSYAPGIQGLYSIETLDSNPDGAHNTLTVAGSAPSEPVFLPPIPSAPPEG